jgi:transposase
MRKRREAKRLRDTAQRQFGFSQNGRRKSAETAEVVSDDRFLPDDPRQIFLANERLENYLSRRGLKWVLRLRKLLERVDYSALTANYHSTGRKAIHPRVMLGLIVYGMLQRQWSLRDLEQLAQRDVGAWWICAGHQPDHSTIGKFIGLHAEVLSEAFFVQLVHKLVSSLKLSPGTVAGDGTIVQAAGAQLRRLKVEVAREQLEQAGASAEVIEGIEERVAERKAKGRGSGQISVALSEPEAVVQPGKDKRVRASYKPSIWAHESGLIVGQHVHPSSETAAVPALGEQHKKVFGAAPKTMLLDAAFCTIGILSEFTEANIDVLSPSGKVVDGQWSKQQRGKFFGKDRFRYDQQADLYHCPSGRTLSYANRRKDRHGQGLRTYRGRQCAQCDLRTQCTSAARGRTIKRYDGEEIKELMAIVLEQPGARRKYLERGVLAETPFAEIKERQGLKRFHRRGLAGVRVEFALHCMAFDLKKVLALRQPCWLFVFTLCVRPHHASRSQVTTIGVLVRPNS